MLIQLRSVGFPVETANDAIGLAQAAAPESAVHKTSSGTYRRLAISDGTDAVEVWLHYDPAGKPLGLHPHFMGHGRLRTYIVAHWPDTIDHLLGYACLAVQPRLAGENPYPIVVAIPNYEMELPVLTANEQAKDQTIVAVVQVTAYAETIALFPNETMFWESSDDMKQFGAARVAPIGMFDLNSIRERGPQPRIQMSGYIEACERRRLPGADCDFWWLSVSTEHGWMDIVCESDLLPKVVEPGMVASGSFWLSVHFLPNIMRDRTKLPRVNREGFQDSELQLITPAGPLDLAAYLNKQLRVANRPSILAIILTACSLFCLPIGPVAFVVSLRALVRQRRLRGYLLLLNLLLVCVSGAVTAIMVLMIRALLRGGLAAP